MESKEEILKAMGGIPQEVYDEIVLTFYEEARERLKGIMTSIKSNDFEGVLKGAHAIKGSAANLRLTQIQGIAKALEDAAKAGDPGELLKFQEQLARLIPSKENNDL